MKKSNFILIFNLALFLVFSITQTNAQIHSTTGGGAWNDTLTWTTWSIPTATDDVVIQGIVDVTGAECNNLMIKANGILQNRSYTNYTLRVNGNVTNNGIIRDYPEWYHLFITVKGDIINNGEWSNEYTYLTGSQDQHLNFSKEFSGYRIEDADNTSAIIADSDITFKHTKIDLKGSTLRLGQGTKLYLYGEWIFNGQIIGNGSELYMYDNSFLERISIDNVAIKGIINVFSSVVLEEESVIDLE
ncbi:MAG: hypothetical protein K8R58_01665 [Bacteroidales bacterium]|nr:hypothetical protein [Bacteroidales bacterium]